MLDLDSRLRDGAKILETVIELSTLRRFGGIKRLVANSIKRTRVASPKVMTRIVPGLELRGFWSSWPDPSLHQKQQPLIFLKSFSGLQARASQLLLFVLVR